MVTLEMVNSLRTACDLLERRRIGLDNINGYIDIWTSNVNGWTSSQLGMFGFIREQESAAVVMATLNMLAAEITYQHAKHVWETVRK